MSEDFHKQALSFGGVSDAYDRARPSYPAEAVRWLAGSGRSVVLELGAGTGKLTELLVADGHEVAATDPDHAMLQQLRRRTPQAHAVVASAEHIPMPSRSVDLVACAQSFHWFDHDLALPEIARVLRPGGVLALVWNMRDEAIPWVKRLGQIIGIHDRITGQIEPLRQSTDFGWVEERTFRFWQSLTRSSLTELVSSRSNVAVLSADERESVLTRVGELYDEYGRGHDGMLLPYLTHCYRAVVHHQQPPPPDPEKPPQARRPDDPDTDALLIDFH
ncbi:MAG: class I SAM-dependent methyltransferase [Actinomycetota bacterium]|nr:class I SAM-dependent methyltransferase [Actinomycetota bacterium]